MLPLVILY